MNKKYLTKQEIQAYYKIPAIRKTIIKDLCEVHRIKQNAIAKIMGTTEASVSQYIKGNRRKEIGFIEDIKIKKVTDMIAEHYKQGKEIDMKKTIENLAEVVQYGIRRKRYGR